MKHLKMIALGALAAMALMAFGASTASATELYQLRTGTGPDTLNAGSVIDTSPSGSSIVETTSGEVPFTCTGGTIKGKSSNAGSAIGTVLVNIEELTWNECTRPMTTVKNGSLEMHHMVGTTNGAVTGAGSEWTISGIFGTSCAYGTATGTDLGVLTTGNTHSHATLAIKATIPRTAGGFLCPSSMIWTPTTPLHRRQA